MRGKFLQPCYGTPRPVTRSDLAQVSCAMHGSDSHADLSLEPSRLSTSARVTHTFIGSRMTLHIVKLKLNLFLRLKHQDTTSSVALATLVVVLLPNSWRTIAEVYDQRPLKVTTSSPVELSLLTQWNIKILTYARNLPLLGIKLKVKASIIVALKGLKSVQRSFRLDFVTKRSST